MLFAASSSEYKYELTPVIGFAKPEGNLNLGEGYKNLGLNLGINLDESMFDQVEIGFLRTLGEADYVNNNFVVGDTDITRVYSNVVKEYPLYSNLSLYALAGIGFEYFSNEAYSNENSLFGNYGIGMKFKFENDVALKIDYRHLVETDHGDNHLITTFGLSFPFGKKATEAPVVTETPKPQPQPVEKEEPAMDSDGDGVIDLKDKCPDTPKGDIVDENGCSLKVDLNINFAFDSAVINNSYDSKIKRFAEFMKAFPAVKAKIEAHTDSVGTEEYNQDLSERRAASTVKALQAYGIKKDRLNSTGYGETMPLATNETAEGRAQNRRVEGSIQK